MTAAAAFGTSIAQELEATPDETAAFRDNLLELVDSYSALAKQNGLPAYLVDTPASYREDLEAAGEDEFASLATRLGPPVAAATSAVRDIRREIAFDAVPLPGFEKSPGLPGPNYPNVSWSFFIEVFGDEPEGEGSNERRSGVCSPPRQSPNLLFFSQNATLVNEATRDIADQICDLTVAGFNASLACIITDILYIVQHGIYDNLILCEDLIDSAELEASFKRLEHVHDDLEDVESNLTGEINSTEAALAFQIDQVRAALALQIEQTRASLQAEIDANEGSCRRCSRRSAPTATG